jgi:putative transcriptional regulator
VIDLKYNINLAVLLAQRKWNQADLARKAKIRPSTINELYHEIALSISFENLVKICQALDCTPNDLIEIAPYKKPGRPKKIVEQITDPSQISKSKPYTLSYPKSEYNND